MTLEETQSAIKQLKAQGMSEQDILGTFYLMFQDEKIDVNQLEALCDELGYALTEEFKAMSPEDQKTKGFEEVDDNEEVEDAKVYDEDEAENDEEAETEDNSDEEEEEDEETRARKLFGYDK